MSEGWFRVLAALFIAALTVAVVLQFQDRDRDHAYIASVVLVGLPLMILARRFRDKRDA